MRSSGVDGILDERTAARLRRVTVPCAVVAVVIALTAVVGSLTGADRLRSVLANPRSLVALPTSLSLLALGVGILLLVHADRWPRGRVVARVLAALVLAWMLAILAEYVFHIRLGVDLPLHESPQDPHPGRTTMEGAAQFAIGASWLLLYDARRGIARAAALVAMAAIGFLALATLIMFVLAGSYLWDGEHVQRVSLQGLVAFVLLILGGAAWEPERWFLRPLVMRGAVGVASRRMLPAAVAIPLVGGFAFQLVMRHHGSDSADVIATIVALQIVLLVPAGLSTARVLRRLEAERDEFEAELRWMAEHDPLTGLLNRRGFAAALERRRAMPGLAAAFALAVFDLDNFKQLNDSAGHAHGDAVLREIGDILGTALRAGEDAARIGGDEFALLLELQPGADVTARVEDIVALIARREPDLQRTNVQASAGIVHATADRTPEELIAAADAALYEAKRSGGARAVLAEPR